MVSPFFLGRIHNSTQPAIIGSFELMCSCTSIQVLFETINTSMLLYIIETGFLKMLNPSLLQCCSLFFCEGGVIYMVIHQLVRDFPEKKQGDSMVFPTSGPEGWGLYDCGRAPGQRWADLVADTVAAENHGKTMGKHTRNHHGTRMENPWEMIQQISRNCRVWLKWTR